MKLLWHIIKKDIVRDRWALALWALLFVAQTGVGTWVLWGDGEDMNRIVQAQTGSAALVWLQMAVGYVLIARWVHADALLGTTRFWMTRPVSGARLLAAKVAGVILVFGVGPVVLLLPWWGMCGFGAGDLAWVAGQTLGWQMVMILPAVLIAAVTDDLGRVLLGTLVLVLAVSVWASLWQLLPAAKLTVGAGVATTRFWAATAIAVAGIAWIVTRQFLTRRWRQSLVMAVGCVGLVTAVAQMWRWDWTWTRGMPKRTAEGVDAVSLKFLRATTWRAERGTDPAIIVVSWNVTGLPAGLVVRAIAAESVWHWPDGLTFARETRQFDWNWTAGDPFGPELAPFDDRKDRETLESRIASVKQARQRWIARFGGDSKGMTFFDSELAFLEGYARNGRDEPGEVLGKGARMEVMPSLAAKMRATPSEMKGSLALSLVKPELLMEMPWKDGQRVAAKGLTLRLSRLGMTKGTTVARLVVSQASRSPWPAVFSKGSVSLGTADNEYGNGQLMALNRALGDKVNVRMESWSPALIGGVLVSWRKLSLTEPWVIREGKRLPRGPGWLEGATLAVVAEKELGTFTKEARVEGFLLGK